MRAATSPRSGALFYVGLTRAKRHLLVTWEGKPSRFLDGARRARGGEAARPRREEARAHEQTPAVQALREWRLARARAEEVPAYVVFNDRDACGARWRARRARWRSSQAVPGIGQAKLERYGADLLVRLAEVAALTPRYQEMERNATKPALEIPLTSVTPSG